MADANTTQSNAVPVTGAGTSSNASPVAVTETKTDAAKQAAAADARYHFAEHFVHGGR